MSTIASLLRQGKAKRFRENAAEMMPFAHSNLNVNEQMSEFITTNGDIFILPYLNKFEKATLAQGK